VKEYSKTLASRGRPKANQLAGKAIYYAAIASALVFHDRRITQPSYEKLQEAYARLDEKPWGFSKLNELFRRVRAVCRQEMEAPK